ncbi:MAG: peroxiredoxin [Candidatus Melainabacteria bacterium]|nr:MAG: peroxiredoxin [Candidatus Melainabacteria bacterium]
MISLKSLSLPLLASILLLSNVAPSAGAKEESKVKETKSHAVRVGDTAPDFSLKSGEGKTVNLADFKGKKSVVLFFYPKDETSVCTKEACAFRDQFQVFKDLGAEVIGVSSDSEESHKGFAEHHKLPYTLLSDDGGKLRKVYGVPSTMGVIPGRVTYVIDKNGIVKHVFNSQMEGEKHVTEAIATLKKISSAN